MQYCHCIATFCFQHTSLYRAKWQYCFTWTTTNFGRWKLDGFTGFRTGQLETFRAAEPSYTPSGIGKNASSTSATPDAKVLPLLAKVLSEDCQTTRMGTAAEISFAWRGAWRWSLPALSNEFEIGPDRRGRTA